MERKISFHKSTPLDPNLSQINPIHVLTPYFLKIHFDTRLGHTSNKQS